MTIVVCGRTNLSERAEAITRVLREAQGFCLDVGCGRGFDLDNELQHMGVARCAECWRWLCTPCIVAHFEATSDAYVPGQARSQKVTIAPDLTYGQLNAQEVATDPHQPPTATTERGVALVIGSPRPDIQT